MQEWESLTGSRVPRDGDPGRTLTLPRAAAGAVLTKMDGDSRGGAALSVHEVSGKPIKFVGIGERLEALEPFYPDRLAGRILGMGTIVPTSCMAIG